MPQKDNSSVPKKPKVPATFSAHDPLEELRLAERAQEDMYFRQLDEELIAALRQKDAAEIERAVRQYLHMRCPKCGATLREVPYRSVKVDECPSCGGIWLDKGELEALVGSKAKGWLHRFFEAFIPAH
jgi:uncharacterized C2H2 Zn-finger protein